MRLDRISPNLETAAQEYAAKLAAMKENLTPFLDKPRTPEPRRRPAPAKRTPEKASEERPARQLFQPPGRAGKVIGLADELSLLQGKPRRVGGDARKVGEAYSADTRPERKENTALTLRRLEAEVNRLTKRLELDTSAPSVAAFNAAEEEPEKLHDSGVVERGNVPLTAGEVRSLVDELVTMKARSNGADPGAFSPDLETDRAPFTGITSLLSPELAAQVPRGLVADPAAAQLAAPRDVFEPALQPVAQPMLEMPVDASLEMLECRWGGPPSAVLEPALMDELQALGGEADARSGSSSASAESPRAVKLPSSTSFHPRAVEARRRRQKALDSIGRTESIGRIESALDSEPDVPCRELPLATLFNL